MIKCIHSVLIIQIFTDAANGSPWSDVNNGKSYIRKTKSLHWDGPQKEDTRLISVMFIEALDDVEGLMVVYHVNDNDE